MAVTIIPYPNQIAVSDKRRMLQENELRLQHDDRLKKEGYSLQITKTDAVLSFSTESGKFYGLQTLRQLRDTDGSVPLCAIRQSRVERMRFPLRWNRASSRSPIPAGAFFATPKITFSVSSNCSWTSARA